jgi:uncharacterized protein (DUF1810 family)
MITGMTPDSSNEFDHFLEAQSRVYDQVVEELTRGQKRSHWMWFIFPQVRGLGHSAMAQRFAIDCLDQARRYALHILLGQRLRQCTRLVLDVQGRGISDILGFPDDLKFRSSMTLFEIAAPEEPLFNSALKKYFAGQRDLRTLEILGLNDG